jgi:hypothetical protein
MKPFFLKTDAQNKPSGIQFAPDYAEAVLLAANVEQTVTVPTAAKDGFVLFSADGYFWARPNHTAAIPTGATTDGSGSVLNPLNWGLDGVATIHLIADTTTKISLVFYRTR